MVMENTTFIGRNIEITDAMRQHAEEKINRLSRFYENIIDAKVVMAYSPKGTSNPAKVEVQLSVPNGIIRAEESAIDTYSAMDLVGDKLERQLKRFKERNNTRRSDVNATPIADIEPLLDAQDDDTYPEIVRVKRHVLRPMSPEDAAMEMESLGHDFYMFRNAENNQVSVIYLRADGDYGLLEPA